ncbi:MAG: hypothetical protein AB1916_05180 [Thermodesulfobacteriota bacterium]
MERAKLLDRIIEIIRSLYPGGGAAPLHAPAFLGKGKERLAQCVESAFVSSAWFEEMVRECVGAARAAATVSAAAGLHLALLGVGV